MPAALSPTGVDDQTLGVDGDCMRPRFGEQQLCVGQRITGVLNPHLVAGREQHTNRDVDCLLCTARDDDLLGIAAHCSHRPQIVTDVPAQFGEAGRIRVTEVVRSQPTHGAMRQAAPRLGGTRIDQRAAGVERAGVALQRRSLEVGKGLRRCRHDALCRARSAAPS